MPSASESCELVNHVYRYMGVIKPNIHTQKLRLIIGVIQVTYMYMILVYLCVYMYMHMYIW